MKIEVLTTPTFDREYKRLRKKYKSLNADLARLEEDIINNPNIGIDLGGNVRKIRLAIQSKNRGKSGGARIITYSILVSIVERQIWLITIYDKSDEDSITDTQIQQIIKDNDLI